MTDEELARHMALTFVCPRTMEPATIYEHDAVAALTAFSYQVLAERDEWKRRVEMAQDDDASFYEPQIELLRRALTDLMDGVQRLPPLTAIEGMLIGEFERARAALEATKPIAHRGE